MRIQKWTFTNTGIDDVEDTIHEQLTCKVYFFRKIRRQIYFFRIRSQRNARIRINPVGVWMFWIYKPLWNFSKAWNAKYVFGLKNLDKDFLEKRNLVLTGTGDRVTHKIKLLFLHMTNRLVWSDWQFTDTSSHAGEVAL